MEQRFNWSVERTVLGLAVVVVVLLVGLVVLALRARALWTVGARNLARRPLRAALIVFGLMLSTTVIGTAFGTGSTITYSLQSLVTGSLGAVDEVIIQNPPRGRGLAGARTFTQPGLAALASANPQPFAASIVDGLATTTGAGGAVRGLLPAVLAQATIIHPASQRLEQLPLLAVPPPDPAAWGALLTADNQTITLDTLGADGALLNAAAAALLDAHAGDALTVTVGAQSWGLRVGAVVQNGGLGGLEPLVLVPLAEHQRRTNQSDTINLVLAANQGGAAGVARSAAATRALRAPLADRAIAQQLHDLLARPAVQRGLVEAEGNLAARDRPALAALRVAAADPALTDEFISLISDARLRGRLAVLARRFPDADVRQRAPQLLQQIATISVLPLKQEALDRASQYGAVITTVFLVLGLFSLAAAIMLLFLIFALLAADRAVELATMRVLGMRRWQIMQLFLFEGMIYNLLGALAGTAASVAIAYGLSRALAGGLAPFGIVVVPYVEPRSLAITLLAGVLLIFAAMVIAVRRVSRLELVAATRGVLRGAGAGSPWLAALLLVAAVAAWWLGQPATGSGLPRHPLVAPTVAAFALLGLAALGLALLGRRSSPGRARLATTLTALAGLGLSAIWLATLLGVSSQAIPTRDAAITLVVAGCALLPASVWTVSQGLAPALRGLDRALGGLPRLRAVVRPAAGALAANRWRTALTVVMFGMVMLMIVLALTLIQVAASAYAPTEAPVAGFALRADVQRQAIPDLAAALATAPAISRAAFESIGGVATIDGQVIQLGAPRAAWQSAALNVVDDGFLGAIAASFDRRAAGYADDAAVWAALRTQPGAAVITAGMLQGGVALPAGATDTAFGALTVWARPTAGGQPVRLTVLGIVSSRAELDEGMYVAPPTAAGLGVTVPTPGSYFLAVAPDTTVANAAAGLRVSFAGTGLAVTTLGETLQIANAVRQVLIQVVQGFMGLGLVAGVAALGLLSVQAVIERRQQLGMLRALGFTRRQTRTLLLLESTIIALLGLALGVALGLALARSLVAVLAQSYPEVRFAVPWGQIGLTTLLACAAAGLAITAATAEAGRIAPAEALRSV